MTDRTDLRLSPRAIELRRKIRGVVGSPSYFDGRTTAEVEESRRMTATADYPGCSTKRKARRRGKQRAA